MAWWITVTELVDEWGEGKGLYRLIAYSHIKKEAHSLCNHNHHTPDEAKKCLEAIKNRANFEN